MRGTKGRREWEGEAGTADTEFGLRATDGVGFNTLEGEISKYANRLRKRGDEDSEIRAPEEAGTGPLHPYQGKALHAYMPISIQ